MGDTKRDFYGVCPSCWSVKVKRRTYKTPKYLCEVCGAVFNQKKRISNDQRKLFTDVLKLIRNRTEYILSLTHSGITNGEIRKCVLEQVRGLECEK